MSASIWQIAIVIIVVAVLFGGKRLRNLGGDLGASLKGFKNAMKEDEVEVANIEHKKSDIESSATVQETDNANKS